VAEDPVVKTCGIAGTTGPTRQTPASRHVQYDAIGERSQCGDFRLGKQCKANSWTLTGH